jgi:Tol biopolymer transport system component
MSTDLRERFADAALRQAPPLDFDVLWARHQKRSRVRRRAVATLAVMVIAGFGLGVSRLLPVDGAPIIVGPGPTQDETTDADSSEPPADTDGALVPGSEGEFIVAARHEGSRNFNLYRMRIDGSELFRLTDHPGEDAFPEISPDGTRVVFVRNQYGDVWDVFVVNIDGSELTQITANPYRDWAPTWTPDGERILFWRRPADIYMDGEIWSGTAGGTDGDIWSVAADGTDERVLIAEEGYQDSGPGVSPDGDTIAYSRLILDPEALNGYKVELWLADSDGTNRHRLFAQGDLKPWLPRWSPDGARIVFFATDDEPALAHDIYVINADGTGLRQLTSQKGDRTGDWNPHWSPDGTRILFNGMHESSRRGVYVMDDDGSNLRRLTDEGAAFRATSWGRREP